MPILLGLISKLITKNYHDQIKKLYYFKESWQYQTFRFLKSELCYGSPSSGFTRTSPSLWARGQDLFLVISGSWVQASSATSMVYLLKATQSLHLVNPYVI